MKTGEIKNCEGFDAGERSGHSFTFVPRAINNHKYTARVTSMSRNIGFGRSRRKLTPHFRVVVLSTQVGRMAGLASQD
jgi:hypothetical protein